MSVRCVCCVLCRYRPLQRADHSFIEVLPGVCVCVCVVCVVKEPQQSDGLDQSVTHKQNVTVSADSIAKRTEHCMYL